MLLVGLKHFETIPGLVSDFIVLKGLTVCGGSGFTPESMAKAVAMLEAGEVKADVLLGEVFTLDGIDEAMGLLARDRPHPRRGQSRFEARLLSLASRTSDPV